MEPNYPFIPKLLHCLHDTGLQVIATAICYNDDQVVYTFIFRDVDPNITTIPEEYWKDPDHLKLFRARETKRADILAFFAGNVCYEYGIYTEQTGHILLKGFNIHNILNNLVQLTFTHKI